MAYDGEAGLGRGSAALPHRPAGGISPWSVCSSWCSAHFDATSRSDLMEPETNRFCWSAATWTMAVLFALVLVTYLFGGFEPQVVAQG